MYCLKQVYKMCYYIAHIYEVEILKMRCEFVKDHNGTIWFQYASGIQCRPNMKAEKATEAFNKIVKRINDELKTKYLSEMHQHRY
mgnify:CR=1 FL=1